MKDGILGAAVGGLAAAILFISGVFNGDSQSPTISTAITPTPMVAPAPDVLSCPPTFTETQRAVAHVDGANDVGYISCDIVGKYNLTITVDGTSVLRDWSGLEVTDPAEKTRIISGN